MIIVSATSRRRDIKIPLNLSPRSEKFNIVSNDYGRTLKPVLKTITHLIQYTVLEIQFNERPLFCFVLVLSSVIIAQ